MTLLIAGGSLALGSFGYHVWGDLDWIDSFYNASMILTGMGPVNPITTVRGKLFASFYTLYSGIAFLSMISNALTLLSVSIFWQIVVTGVVLIVAVSIDVLLRRRRA